jgi:SAM-dependent methyltransferase
MVELLNIKSGDRVLETGCGTCRDSVRIANRLGPKGALYLQDLSPGMIEVGRRRIAQIGSSNATPEIEFLIGNATQLPFPDNYFDSCFHFGGLNLFSDKTSAISEMARVVKPGGKVVFGDESMAPWLRETENGKMLLNSNHLYRYPVPTECIPENAHDVCVRWIIGSCFYLVDFRVGEHGPRVDLDKPILGFRGGTHRSRYFGAMEGVTLETKALAESAARASKLSMHDWLDQAVRARATEDLKKK